jgi:hypothetical protein
MANSPLVVPGSTEKGTSTSNHSRLSTAAPSSNGATPEVAQSNNGAGRDLAEQMNEEEKQKYIKGHSHQQIPFALHSNFFQAKSSVKEPMPTSISATSTPTLPNSSPSKKSKSRKNTQKVSPPMLSANSNFSKNYPIQTSFPSSPSFLPKTKTSTSSSNSYLSVTSKCSLKTQKGFGTELLI